MTTATRAFRGLWLGTRPYQAVFDLQERLSVERAEGRIGDTVLLLEHTPVITLGRGADPSHLLFDKEALAARGVDTVTTNRGGDVTLHAPGQLVAYPIIDLRPDRCDVRKYVRDLTETMRRVSLRHGVSAGRVEKLIGLWVDRNSIGNWPGEAGATALTKLGAVGVRISRWVTTHGFALNLTTDSELFGLIVPCGIREHGVTSIFELTGSRPNVKEEAKMALGELSALFDADASFEDRSNDELACIS